LIRTTWIAGFSWSALKAGGLGLNRAHRIGPTRQVFAYRLIARDTVEEKVLELQKILPPLSSARTTA
jgi:SNF2 family DNA or RNA helicase